MTIALLTLVSILARSCRAAIPLASLASCAFVGSPVRGQDIEWSQLGPVQEHIAPRSGHAMAYDAARGVTVLFGGINGSAINCETWGVRSIPAPHVEPIPKNADK